MRQLPKDFWIGIVLWLIFSFLLGEWALREAARDNGNYDLLPGMIFPYGVLVIYFGGNVWGAFSLTGLQYAAYATVFAFAWNRGRMVIRLSVLHAIFATSCCLIAWHNGLS